MWSQEETNMTELHVVSCNWTTHFLDSKNRTIFSVFFPTPILLPTDYKLLLLLSVLKFIFLFKYHNPFYFLLPLLTTNSQNKLNKHIEIIKEWTWCSERFRNDKTRFHNDDNGTQFHRHDEIAAEKEIQNENQTVGTKKATLKFNWVSRFGFHLFNFKP